MNDEELIAEVNKEVSELYDLKCNESFKVYRVDDHSFVSTYKANNSENDIVKHSVIIGLPIEKNLDKFSLIMKARHLATAITKGRCGYIGEPCYG